MNDARSTSPSSNGYSKWVLAIALLPTCWLWMMIVHELGHVLVAWTTGAPVTRVILHPLAISRTDIGAPNQHPLAIVWGGPLIGMLLPLAAALLFRSMRWSGRHVAQFFAGFCLLANGLYLAIGSFDHVGDAGSILRYGTPMWVLWSVGVVTAPAGLWLWHGLGPHFGFGPHAEPVDWRVASIVVALLIATVILELIWTSCAG